MSLTISLNEIKNGCTYNLTANACGGHPYTGTDINNNSYSYYNYFLYSGYPGNLTNTTLSSGQMVIIDTVNATFNYNGVPPGYYTLQVTDMLTTDTTTIVVGPVILLTSNNAHGSSCLTTVTINITGGSAPYTYNIYENNELLGTHTTSSSNPTFSIPSSSSPSKFILCQSH